MRAFLIITFVVLFIFHGCENKMELAFEDNPYVSYHFLTSDGSIFLKFALVMPEYYSSETAYPVLLTFPPGDQTQAMVEWELEKYWIKSTIQQGWIVVSPISPYDTTFFEGAEKYIPNLMEWVRTNYNVEGDKFHIAGVSNGGKSAFRIAIEHSDQVQSLTVLPGFPPSKDDFNKLNRLKSIPVTMYVGENDNTWLNESQKTYDELRDLHASHVRLHILKKEGHELESLTSSELIQVLEDARPKDLY